jgi:hypothetical protein
MSSGKQGSGQLKCADARRWFRALEDGNAPDGIRESVTQHTSGCDRCGAEYRLFRLERTVLDLGGTSESVAPDDAFFRGLRARIARGSDGERTAGPAGQNDLWSSMLWVTGRQLVPAMAMLLLLMIGATVLWDQGPQDGGLSAEGPMDRLFLRDVYEYPEPTTDEVLDALVAVQERTNGR